VKKAVAYINDFERSAAHIAITDGLDHVVCGHIHQPQIRRITMAHGSVGYMNSGDWIEHMSALEYTDNTWSLYMHQQATVARQEEQKQASLEPELA
jgi:UDP-2,3-diacylglucosamine pyrophosphatase LpxH